jgi:UDPglucose 6-dehydrogenase
VNNNQKKYFLNKITNRFFDQNKSLNGMCFGIWGLSFKPGTDDMRESPSIYIINKILDFGGSLKVYDPKAMEVARNYYLKGLDNIEYCDDRYDVLKASDALILITEWPEFRSPDFNLIKNTLNLPVIFDGRNQYNYKDLNKLGFEYYQIGRND